MLFRLCVRIMTVIVVTRTLLWGLIIDNIILAILVCCPVNPLDPAYTPQQEVIRTLDPITSTCEYVLLNSSVPDRTGHSFIHTSGANINQELKPIFQPMRNTYQLIRDTINARSQSGTQAGACGVKGATEASGDHSLAHSSQDNCRPNCPQCPEFTAEQCEDAESSEPKERQEEYLTYAQALKEGFLQLGDKCTSDEGTSGRTNSVYPGVIWKPALFWISFTPSV